MKKLISTALCIVLIFCYALSFTGGATIKWYRDNFAKYEQMIAEKEGKNRQSKLKDLTFGLIDLSVLVFFFLSNG